MREIIISHGRRFAAVIALFSISAITPAFINSEKIKSDPVINPDEYEFLMSHKVGDIYDLEQYFVLHQYDYLPITPPPADFVLQQSGMPDVLPFDGKAFPKEFIAGLVGTYEYSALVYPLVVLEDQKTREIVFHNSVGKEIYTLPPAPGYDPYAYLKSRWSALYSGKASLQTVNYWQGVYDPARVQLRTKLIPMEYVEPYLYAQAKVMEAAAMLQVEGEYGGMPSRRSHSEGGMMLMGGESDSNIVFTAIYKTNIVAVTIAYPEDFTNRLDVYTGNDLMPEIWSFAVRELPTTGTNQITWTDTNSWIQAGLPVRFYAAGNADLDTDGDGYADAREIMVYKTDHEDIDYHPVKVSGTVSYFGIETGTIFVVWVTESNSWSTAKSITMPVPAAYTNEEVGNDESYWIKAFRDANGNNTLDAWEPTGMYSNNSILITGDIAGVNITMADVPAIWGTIDYSGSETGDIYVIAVTSSNSWDTTYKTVIPWTQGENNELGGGVFYVTFPVEFSIVGMPISNYWIRAFIDSDSDTAFTLGEAAGQFTSNGISVSNRVTGIDFILALDSDGDEMPDWWEWQYGFDPFDDGDMRLDRDSDGAENFKEFLFGTDPDDPDTDGDGMPDGWEILYSLAPLTPADSTGDSDIDGLENLIEYELGTNPSSGDTDLDRISDGPLDPDWAGPVVAGPDTNPTIPAPLHLPDHVTPDARHVAHIGEDAQGRPTIVWLGKDNRGLNQLYAFKWFGTAPETLGQWAQLDGMWECFGNSGSVSGIVASTGGIYECDADYDTNGWPTVSWTEDRGSGKSVYALRWQTNQWVVLGGSFSGSGISGGSNIQGNPSIALEPDGSLSVAWEKVVSGGLSIHLKRWSQSLQTWAALGNSTNTYGLIGSSGTFVNPQVAVGNDSRPVVTYWLNTNNVDVAIYARKWDGSSAWNLLGSTIDGTPSEESLSPDIIIGNANTPQIGWIESVTGLALRVRQYTNSVWSGYGSSDSGTGLATGTFLNIYGHSIWRQTNGNVGASWSQSVGGCDYAVFARQWNGSAWRDIGTTNIMSVVRGPGSRASWTKVTASKGSPVIVYAEKIGPNASDPCRIVVKQFVADSDGDGLSDLFENANGLNSSSSDSDGDGISDGLEWNIYGTDPTNVDSDGDGLTDGEESNGTKWGVWSDPLNPDMDGDGIQDECDPFPNSPVGDSDGDGITDDLDSDDDSDGWSDSYETGTSGTDPLNPDSDCDGIPDSLDTGGADTTPPVINIIEPVAGALP